jgi:hypothetical protein
MSSRQGETKDEENARGASLQHCDVAALQGLERRMMAMAIDGREWEW